MKTPGQLLKASLCLALAFLAGGCSTTTNALWQRQAYHPAERPLIRLSSDPHRQDILVRYDEQMNNSLVVQERAYWLFASTNSPTKSGAPNFVAVSDLPSLNHLVDVPVYHSIRELQHSSAHGYAALAEPEDRSFELWRDGKRIQTYMLPSYYTRRAPATPLRVVLTPGAVTADAAVTFCKDTGKAMKEVGEAAPIIILYAGAGALQWYALH